ncbi:reverse transcriptase [Caerostris darwini]|uniref:Reverse transcriptase n=1 Tax=Caerostris darwini TaxID=1538125 RepID=A0AAV4R2S9_9ARAC|nr:reverse transcriptase [Caerostris darwini]
MQLHQWCSSGNFLTESDEADYSFSPEEIKTLGIIWQPNKDCFSFKVKVDCDNSFTKRAVLSTVEKIFDPLGLLGPIVTKAKIFLQKLWLIKQDWNDNLPKKELEE